MPLNRHIPADLRRQEGETYSQFEQRLYDMYYAQAIARRRSNDRAVRWMFYLAAGALLFFVAVGMILAFVILPTIAATY